MSPSLYRSVAETAVFRCANVTLVDVRRLLAVPRCAATLVKRNAGRRIYSAWRKARSMKCSLEWHLYITARSVHRCVINEVEKKDTRPALPRDFWQKHPFPMSAARANSRDDALAHVLPVKASRARNEEPLTYEIISMERSRQGAAMTDVQAPQIFCGPSPH